MGMQNRLFFTLIVIIAVGGQLRGQIDSIFHKISFEADFRFRAEQDWDSRRSDGTYRDDRSRLRYRFRTGATFTKDWYSFGFRIRTGDQRKQQDPQLTVGKGLKEFGTLPLGFEKVYFSGQHLNILFWLGKNTFSFEKNNELFWSDNVYPEGVFIQQSFDVSDRIIEEVIIKGGHHILSSNDGSLLDDAYLQGIQSLFIFDNQRLKVFPAIYLMRNIPDIPDGAHTFELDYTILHFGAKWYPITSKKIYIDMDLYRNLEDYSMVDGVQENFKNEKGGYSIGLQYGVLRDPKEWMFKVTYTSLGRYAILDYMAQNDWARWDYSAFDSPDGRLSNMQGFELVAGYNLTAKAKLIAKYYAVDQLVQTGDARENGQRFRLDLDVKL